MCRGGALDERHPAWCSLQEESDGNAPRKRNGTGASSYWHMGERGGPIRINGTRMKAAVPKEGMLTFTDAEGARHNRN